MHCSIWRFVGDPDELERRYLALMAEIPEVEPRAPRLREDPRRAARLRHLSEEQYRAFSDANGPASALFAEHGLVPETREAHPVLRAYAAGARADPAVLTHP